MTISNPTNENDIQIVDGSGIYTDGKVFSIGKEIIDNDLSGEKKHAAEKYLSKVAEAVDFETVKAMGETPSRKHLLNVLEQIRVEGTLLGTPFWSAHSELVREMNGSTPGCEWLAENQISPKSSDFIGVFFLLSWYERTGVYTEVGSLAYMKERIGISESEWLQGKIEGVLTCQSTEDVRGITEEIFDELGLEEDVGDLEAEQEEMYPEYGVMSED